MSKNSHNSFIINFMELYVSKPRKSSRISVLQCSARRNCHHYLGTIWLCYSQRSVFPSLEGGNECLFIQQSRVADATVCRHHGGPIESPPRTSRHYGTEGFKENLHLRPHYTERQHQMRKILPVRTFPCRRESPDVILPNCLQI